MAKIYLIARPPIEVGEERAKELKEKWLNGTLEDRVDLGKDTFFKKDLKGFGDILKEEELEKDNLSNPEYKEKIKQFEREFYAWIDKNPEQRKNAFAHIAYFESFGAIKVDWSNPPPDITLVKNIKLYQDLQKKWSDLQGLNSKRESAKEYQKQSMKTLDLKDSGAN